MKTYWLYRVVFFACIALAVGGVLFTLSSRQRNVARANTSRSRDPALARPAAGERPAPQRPDTLTALASRIRITTVIPFRNEIGLYNFGDAAEDLTDWKLLSPRPGGDDSYTFPPGTVLLPGESLVVVADDGIDQAGELHWRAPADVRVLDLAADTVSLFDERDVEVSRFQYLRR